MHELNTSVDKSFTAVLLKDRQSLMISAFKKANNDYKLNLKFQEFESSSTGNNLVFVNGIEYSKRKKYKKR